VTRYIFPEVDDNVFEVSCHALVVVLLLLTIATTTPTATTAHTTTIATAIVGAQRARLRPCVTTLTTLTTFTILIITTITKSTLTIITLPHPPPPQPLNDDGQEIEPAWYCPVVPMVLINGSSGIGTGYSSMFFSQHHTALCEHRSKK
jgi:hypothetical protein